MAVFLLSFLAPAGKITIDTDSEIETINWPTIVRITKHPVI
jgi:hypothetical protein